jgi:hypothetical protein
MSTYEAPPPTAEDLAADPLFALLEITERHGMENAEATAERLARKAGEFAADLQCWKARRSTLTARQRRELYRLAENKEADDPSKLLAKLSDLRALAGHWSPFQEETQQAIAGNEKEHERASRLIFPTKP